MKKLLLVLGFALASGLAIAEPEAAQDAPPHGQPGGHHPAWHDEIGITDEQRQEMRRIHESQGSRADINAVLTPEQQEKVRAMKDTQRGGGRGLEQLREELGLSDEQLAQMKKIREEGGSRQDMAKVLTPEQKEKLGQLKPRQRSLHQAPPRPQGPPPTGDAPAGWGLKKPE